VTAVTAFLAFLTDPSFDLPLVLAVVLAVMVGWWVRARTAPLPSMVARPGHEWWNKRPDTVAYVALEQGRYFLALSALWLRLATVVHEHLHVGIDSRHDLDRASMETELPPPLTLRRVVRSLSRAYGSAYRAELPSWLELRWPWLQRRAKRRAERDFDRAVHDVAEALPVLEAL